MAGEILSHLSSGEWISGEEIASRQGVSRAAVWKQIKSLRLKGYQIEAFPRRGYRLVHIPDGLNAELIHCGLKTSWLGGDVRCFAEVDSTNEVCRSIARSCKNGTVVLSEIQTQGRGRLSRPWISPPGGIWMSLILKPEISLDRAYGINMAVSVALARAIEGLYPLTVGIKWPNDLLINDRKICGILMEVSAEVGRLEYAIVGVGINANVDVTDFPEDWHSTSLFRELGKEVSRVALTQRILQEIEKAYEKMGSEEIYEEWRRRSVTLGKLVRIASSGGDLHGQVVDLARDGALCLETEEGIHRVLAGDCIHLRESA